MRDCSHSVSELLPHAPPMVLLDDVLSWDEGRISVTLIIRPGIPFYEDKRGVPTHIGLEYMAQACGVYAGIEGLNRGWPVRLGFLLGTRNFRASTDWFLEGYRLVIDATEIFRQDLMGAFDCRISHEGNELASAQLNLYQPDDAASVLGQLSGV